MEYRIGDNITMKKELKFIFIDDAYNRKKQNDFLDDNKLIECKFYYVKEKNILEKIKNEIFKKNEPDLILIDHRLDKVKNTLILSGSSYADIIREEWPECPIIAVTAIKDLNKEITSRQRENYDEIIKGNELKDKHSTLIAIARSNNNLKNNIIEDVNELLKLLNPSEDDINRLKTIIPENVTSNLGEKGVIFEISKWIRKTLFTRPGFLYDKLWTSTILGIKDTSFEKVEQFFTQAKYQSLYSNEDDIRWWQSKIKEILFSKFPDDEEYLPYKLGHKFDCIKESDYSVCHVCGDYFPETVAYTDETIKKKYPMHLKCTVPLEIIPDLLFFEELRVMKKPE